MKKIMMRLFVAAFLSAPLAGFTQLHNPPVYMFCYFKGNGDGLHLASSTDGYTWNALLGDSIIVKPTLSKDKLMRDPCIIKGGDGLYHMVWTVSWNERGIGYASSPNLIHWAPQQFIPVMMQEDSAKNSWAPEITYDKKKKEYMIYWATTIPGRFPQKDTSAEGRKNNHRIYYVVTKDFHNYSKTKLLYDPGFSVIDASIVFDKNRYVMFLKNETRSPAEKNIRVAFATKLTGPYRQPGPAITGKYWAEGPTAIKINNTWMVYFDKYTNHQYGAVTSPDLIHWTDVSDKVHFPKGIRHGTIFTISKEEFEKYFSKTGL